MSPFVWILGAAAAAYVLTSGDSAPAVGGLTKPAPKRVGRVLNSYAPPTLRSTAPGAQRETAPDGLKWKEYSGSLVIGSIRKPTKDVPPGYDTLDLAEVYRGPGPVRVFADAYVVDFTPAGESTIAAVMNVELSHYNSGAQLDTRKPTEQAERIVRDFSTSNDGLVEGLQTSQLIEHNEADPPNGVLAFYGEDCHIGRVTAENMLYHLDDCRGAFNETSGKPQYAYAKNRQYDLGLEVRGDGSVYLVARIHRLPARQYLNWRAYVAARLA